MGKAGRYGAGGVVIRSGNCLNNMVPCPAEQMVARNAMNHCLTTKITGVAQRWSGSAATAAKRYVGTAAANRVAPASDNHPRSAAA